MLERFKLAEKHMAIKITSFVNMVTERYIQVLYMVKVNYIHVNPVRKRIVEKHLITFIQMPLIM
jgi:hypothetical protein